MPITLLDGILIGFTLVSAMLAMVRGFSREVLSIASWVAAAAAAYFLYPAVLPYVSPHVDNPKIAMAVSAAIVFFIALIVVTVITMKLADFIIDSRIGALDRTLGFLYGAARGVLVVAVALMFFNWLVGDNPPLWVKEAKSRPLLDDIGHRIEAMLPADAENSILKHLKPQNAAPETTSPDNATPDNATPDGNAPDNGGGGDDDGGNGNDTAPPTDNGQTNG